MRSGQFSPSFLQLSRASQRPVEASSPTDVVPRTDLDRHRQAGGTPRLFALRLARRSGLDATSFNRSKRIGADGRKRWPSTESVSKVLAATGASLDEFLRLIEAREGPARSTVPLIGMTQAGAGRMFTEDGLPTGGAGWEEIDFPDLGEERAFALEVQGDSMLPPFRDSDVLIV